MDYVTQQFVIAARKLNAEIAALRKSIETILDQYERHREKEESENEHHEPVPLPTLSVNATCATEQNEQRQTRATENRHLWVQVLVAIGTWAAFIAAAYYAHIAFGQLQQMKAAVGQTEKQISLANQTVRLDQRPWIYADPQGFTVKVTDGQPITVPFQLLNNGKTPAERISMDIAVYPIDKGQEPDFNYGSGHAHAHISGGSIFPNAPSPKTPMNLPALRHDEQGKPEIIIATKALHKRIASGESQVIVHGKVDYCDIFMVPHWATFCSYASGQPIGNGNKSCTNYNSNDNNSTPDPIACPAAQSQ